ncbi:hypothetical protein CC1G_10948 [Coprinopsis cinerea okayama7|uniref:Mediator of RNA polymerase II transcription subunit 22 n=1 Tax=Coprinopsis cinerea (strain Okayama-7 / 130 / ATCC MYA-4618 / FGSC 9003) TaxID=240176 RepID=A8NT62_COPC7|nr:hypothetical protein CC1G_10948 [Coprinopsis cinerea okayama7\|eukprot:XP_001836167.1 hypothetical protein CC1G_10948 [Coprinopsis cinerea okayama7\
MSRLDNLTKTETDVSRPSALPTANLRVNRTISQQPLIDQSSAEYLENVEEEWNKKVDVEVETLVNGMVDLVNLASIGEKDKFTVAQEAFAAQSRAESMVRAANSLLSIVHSMKLLLLLSDESQTAHRRDAEEKEIREANEETKRKVAALLDELLRKPSGSSASGGSSS